MPAPAPFWNLISLCVPVASLAIGALVLSANHRAGDFAGSLGAGVLFALALAAACTLGGGAAVAALARGERLMLLSILGVVVNGALTLPVLFILLKAG